MVWKWLTVVGLSMTPALIAGRSAAIAAGIGFGLHPWAIIVVVAISSFINGLIMMWLADLSARVPFIKRLLKRFHTPKAIAWCEKWGPWGGMTLGVAFVGPIPILITLKWMIVETRRIIAPLAVSSVLFTFIMYGLVKLGFHQVEDTLNQLDELKQLL